MKKNDRLATYRAKRSFEISPEPRAKSIKSSDSLLFVIHKHAATHLHYDIRFEIDGVLKSWAVPKGPSMSPSDKRLAIVTEDHPIEYAHFEGIIPAPSYGAGTVMVLDIGTFENIRFVGEKLVPLDTCYEDGHLELFLHGTKFNGGFTLVALKSDPTNKNWLMIKKHDEYALKAQSQKNEISALSGRTMEQIKDADEHD